ncbi:MAG: hypothetical protein OXT65_08625, partial [Alphaproteobacteria bacterium]|nr:hypothetical protein [Alphaproteobacteria bacterium]
QVGFSSVADREQKEIAAQLRLRRSLLIGFIVLGLVGYIGLWFDSLHLGWKIPGLSPFLNMLLFGDAPPLIAGSAVDVHIAIWARSAFFCSILSFYPFIVRTWLQLRDLMTGNVLVTFWGATVTVPFVWLFLTDFFGPLVMEVMDIFIQ